MRTGAGFRPRNSGLSGCRVPVTLTPSCQAVCNVPGTQRADRYMAINQTSLSLDFMPCRRCEKFYDSLCSFCRNSTQGSWGVCARPMPEMQMHCSCDRIALCVRVQEPGAVTKLLRQPSWCGKMPQGVHAENAICPCENCSRLALFFIFIKIRDLLRWSGTFLRNI